MAETETAPTGSMNLEDETPASAPIPIAEAAVQAPPPAEEAAAEVDAVEVAGQKYVPVRAVIAERKQRQALQAKAEQADQYAQYAAQLQQQINEAAPYVEFLRNNPHLLQPQQAQAPRSDVPAQAQPDPAAVTLARTLDLYTATGEPDVARAQQIQQLIGQTVQAQTQQAIAPIQQREAQAASSVNFGRALQVKDHDGRTPSADSLRSVWALLPPEDTANPQVAGTLAALALGLDRMRAPGSAPIQAPPAALQTEASGGLPQAAPALNRLEEALAKARGVKPTTWQQNTATFRPGRSNVLEE